jgi:AcrR family transcriptional regulator
MTARLKPNLAVAKPARVRIPNAERSATTRAKLLVATVECLYEVGYHQTSTVLVTERAKVSRGSMLHHFPTKADLMMATSEYIVELRGQMHRTRLDKLATEREKFLHLIDTLWEAFQSPSGIARIEIMLGSRSDPELGPRFRVLHEALEDRHKELVREMAKRLGVRDNRRINAFVQLYAAALRGLAIDALWPRSASDIRGAVALMKEFQEHMLDRMLADAKA